MAESTVRSVFGHARSVESVRALAKRRLPHGLFEFIDRGSDDDIAIRNNCEAFTRIKFRPRVLAGVSSRTSETTLFGRPLGMPLAIAPTGSAGIVWHDGELAMARAAKKARVPFTLAMRSMASVEVIGAIGGDLWFQLYPLRNRADSYAIVDRVHAAGFNTLVITVDTPTLPSRDYNDKNGYSIPFRYSFRGMADMLAHPRWMVGVIGRYLANGGLPRFENLPGSPSISDSMPASAMLTDDLTWDDVKSLRERWQGPLIVKGLLHPKDAVRAVECGADGIIVSNHGGRNVDASLAPIDALPAIADAVAGRSTVMVDGGIRRGADIAKALALGARSVLVGRPTLYGVAVAGEFGADHVLERLRQEFLYCLATLGCTSPALLDADILDLSASADRGRDNAPA